jgi:hypothetical protein
MKWLAAVLGLMLLALPTLEAQAAPRLAVIQVKGMVCPS